MIHKEAWYQEIEDVPSPEEAATSIWAELQTRDPKARLDVEGRTLHLDLRGFILEFQPIGEDLFQLNADPSTACGACCAG